MVIGQETFKDIYTEEELKKLLVRPKNKSFLQYHNWVILISYLPQE